MQAISTRYPVRIKRVDLRSIQNYLNGGSSQISLGKPRLSFFLFRQCRIGLNAMKYVSKIYRKKTRKIKPTVIMLDFVYVTTVIFIF